MKIVVIGMGYVGLSLAVLLAQKNDVVGVDISKDRVDSINSRKSPINDTTLQEYLNKKELALSATTDLQQAVVDANFVIVCTPTNYEETSQSFDTSGIEKIILKVFEYEPKTFIVIKSTIPIGFVRKIRERLKTNSVIFSPEFLREGTALYDNLYPSRIVVGGDSQYAQTFAGLLAEGSLNPNTEILLTGADEAEAIKLFSNAYLAMRVAFFNELDSLALTLNINSREIIEGVCLDPRIGNYYNNPSFGYGGYCLPKDTRQLLSHFRSVPQNIIKAVVDANSTRFDFLADAIMKKQPKTVGIYRLAMKIGSDNFRQSSIQQIAVRLKENGIQVVFYEPEIKFNTYLDARVEKSLTSFKRVVDLIIANRMDSNLDDVLDKVFTRDVFRDN